MPDEEVFTTIERLKRQRAQFSCLGMGCGMTAAVLVAIAVLAYIIWARG